MDAGNREPGFDFEREVRYFYGDDYDWAERIHPVS
jgi:hypothetical protein